MHMNGQIYILVHNEQILLYLTCYQVRCYQVHYFEPKMYFIQHISYHHDVNNSENWCSKLAHFEAEFIGIFPVRNQVFNSERMNAV